MNLIDYNKKKTIPVILLLGGKGSRFSKLDQYPKQLVKLNKYNLLTNIFLYYKKFNINYFILPLGYKSNFFLKFIKNKKYIKKFKINFIINKDDKIKKNSINLKIFNSNKNSTKAERIYKSLVFIDKDFFMVTYGDGLANINIKKQLIFFNKIKKNIITTFKIKSQYGHVKSFMSKVISFQEKPLLKLPINIGYYIFKKKDFLKNYKKNKELENYILPKLSKKNQLRSFQHRGFFFNIDNNKDLIDAKNKYKHI